MTQGKLNEKLACLIQSLKAHLNNRGGRMTSELRKENAPEAFDKRYKLVELYTQLQAANASEISQTTAMTTAIPTYHTLEVKDDVMATFLRGCLCLDYEPEEAFQRYCPCCDSTRIHKTTGEKRQQRTYVIGWEPHARVCTRLERTTRHNKINRYIHEFVQRVLPESYLEPAPYNVDKSKKRTDIEFREKAPATGSHGNLDYVIVKTGSPPEFTSMDLTVRNGQHPNSTAFGTEPPSPEQDVAWYIGYSEKQNKHGKECLPFCITTNGAIDPRAIRWMKTIRSGMDDKDRNGVYSMYNIVRNIATIIWETNFYAAEAAYRAYE